MFIERDLRPELQQLRQLILQGFTGQVYDESYTYMRPLTLTRKEREDKIKQAITLIDALEKEAS